jgi:hypothetical protein
VSQLPPTGEAGTGQEANVSVPQARPDQPTESDTLAIVTLAAAGIAILLLGILIFALIREVRSG